MPSSFALQDQILLSHALDALPFGFAAVSATGELLYANAWVAARLRDHEPSAFLGLWDRGSRNRLAAALPLAVPGNGVRELALGLVDGTHVRVSLESRPGLPAAVVVTIRPDGGGPEAPPSPESEPASLRVLVVEDDVLIRMSITEMLESRGYVVFEAGDGHEALRWHRTETIDILLTDVGLPGMNGVEVAERMRETQPSLPVLFATGDQAANGLQRDASTAIIVKPYGVADLIDAIGRITRVP